MTILGGALFLALAIAWVARRDWLPWILAASAGLPFSTALVVAGNGVPLFTAAGLVAAVFLLRTRPVRTRHWSANALAVFVGWAVVITALAPWAFSGIRVLSARGGLDAQILDPDHLTYTTSTVAQLVYLLVSACVVLFLVRRHAGPRLLEVAFAVGTLASTVRWVSALAGGDRLAFLFDTNPGVAYAFIGPGDRVRGVFSEPSELAAFSLPAAVCFVLLAVRSTGRAALVRWIVAVLAIVNLLQASSGTAVVASAVVVVAGVIALLARSILRGGHGAPWIVMGGLALALVVLAAGDALLDPARAIVADKVGSQSYDSRTGGDLFSLGVLADTWGLGVGVGGNRPSSFALALLSCVGVPGAVAFAVLCAGVLVAAFRRSETVPAAAALLALLVAKVIGTPDLSTPILWLLVAVCAVPAWHASTAPRPTPDLTRTLTPTRTELLCARS